MSHIRKKDVRALIDSIKNSPEVREKKQFLGLINYYLGEVTQKDLDEVRNS